MALSLHSLVDAVAHAGLDYRFLFDAYDRVPFIQGIVVSIELVVATMVGSALAGLLLLIALRHRNVWIAASARAYVELTRNTPTLVQLYCAFLVLNMLITQWLRESHIDNPFKPFFWVVLVLSLHKGAFHAEALRAGFDALPAQTLEGAASLGFDRATRFWRIELPLAFRTALPALVNNFVELVKATALASAIAVGDITYQSIMIWTQRDNVLALMVVILLFFGLLTWLVSRAGRWLERRLWIPGYGA
ncbi:amino acid ABC transporter permease [Paraburkholderia caribensis]|uniref:Amino acid ABC transporter n=1 Tax=Paraburkholderia caribensis TaxID=75105 RepID=A0A9Q6S951_9BURK|nr:amino acid ABC transporter permease [Paraburkholderia caribensis]MCO4880167.1 amino acid ABC transporter permease [Paraburkholderia caribensis]MDR6382426.1 polar amino acid transport system permease protein [Paraburkholderia caribensis]PTB26612.1 amino acid ABC transporter [Paraburkholderia caribensis]QLB66773.1 amino acid ABC transporter [Paraburkholderia caribensis]